MTLMRQKTLQSGDAEALRSLMVAMTQNPMEAPNPVVPNTDAILLPEVLQHSQPPAKPPRPVETVDFSAFVSGGPAPQSQQPRQTMQSQPMSSRAGMISGTQSYSPSASSSSLHSDAQGHLGASNSQSPATRADLSQQVCQLEQYALKSTPQ